MKAWQFQKAFKIAQSSADLSNVTDDHLYGMGLPRFERCVTTLEAFAKFIRWQAQRMNGSWDEEELQQLWLVARDKLTVLN